MDTFALDLVLRWMHIFGGIAAVGGTFFMRLAVLPSVESLPDEYRAGMQLAIRSRWSNVVTGSIALLLISGLVNIVLIVRRYEVPPYYHMLFGLKFLLALAVFFIASVLVGRSAAAERFRRNTRYWLTLNLLLAVLVVALSGVLRTTEKKPKAAPPSDQAARTLECSASIGRFAA
jgi:uncharacterized membrane protein